MNDYYVYSYTEPGQFKPFYIGKGKGNRLYAHLVASNLKKTTLFYNKLRNMLLNGIYPVIKKVLDNLTEQEALHYEEILVGLYGRIDLGTGCLCNLSNGGSDAFKIYLAKKLCGPKSRLGIPPECVLAAAEANRRRPGHRLGAKHTEKARKKMSESHRGVKLSEVHRANMRYGVVLSQGIAVESYNLETGRTIKKYDCMRGAERDDHKVQNIAEVLNGLRKQHHGMGWRYA